MNQPVNEDPATFWRHTVDQRVKRCGWAVQAVTDETTAFLYTIGLTNAGLPELIVFDIPRSETLTFHTLLNAFARQHLKLELRAGQTRELSGITAIISENTHRQSLGALNLYYGKGQYRTLTVTFPGFDFLAE